ncbi:MAG: helix-turn-helix domain-containing protein [Candidatus Dormibacteraeota bacterium]|uniref:Helix-turn-helix domain-containing protein n=1 Tax=Candidatus Amunia macphersoniae TaxID=3127014 RepID=A0A934NGI6_9BACT|nr:helix-turn-helix domain-containing protein [Candidatus Dormibacteraeota bacterium]
MKRAAVTTLPSIDTDHARDPLPEPTRLLSVDDVCGALQCGRTFVYELLQKGELHAIKLGRLTRISPAGLHEFIDRQERAAGGSCSGPPSNPDVQSTGASGISAQPPEFLRTDSSGGRRATK